MKLFLTLLFLFGPIFSFTVARAQKDTTSGANHYLTLKAEGFARTSTEITSSARQILQHRRLPGATLGAEYTRVTSTGFIITSGIRLRSLPVAFQYTVSPSMYNADPDWKNDNSEQFSSYSFIHLYVPLQFGYRFPKVDGGWQPSAQIGLNFNHLYSYELLFSHNIGNQGNTIPIFSIEVFSPSYQSSIWTTYTLNASVSRELGSGNQISIGLLANVSRKTVYNGYYQFYTKDDINEGIYTDKGSYVSLQLGYSFLSRKNKKEKKY